MSSLACKWVFFRSEQNAKEGPIPTFRAQRADEKNGFICLGIMFSLRILVIQI